MAPPADRGRPGGLVGIYALHQMAKGPIYGWQLSDRIAEVTRGGWRPGAGAIYPILKRLVDQGLARTELQRGKKVYVLTAKGKRRIAEFESRIRKGAGRWVNLRHLVLDMVKPSSRHAWAVEQLRWSLKAFADTAASLEGPAGRRLALSGAKELRRSLAVLEHPPKKRAGKTPG